MGLNPSKLSKQEPDDEFNYYTKPPLKSGRVSGIPTHDIIHEIASFMTLKEIVNSFSFLSKEIRTMVFLNPCSPHWKIIKLSDEIMFGDSQMKYLIRNGVIFNTETIILRRTNCTSHSLKLITKFVHKHSENNKLSLIDIRGCCKISRKSRKLLQRIKPSIQVQYENISVAPEDYFVSSKTVIDETAHIFSSSKYFHRIAATTATQQLLGNNIIHYGCSVMSCECDYCSSMNVRMKTLMTMFGPFYLDVLVGTFRYEFFDEPISTRPVVIDCFRPVFGTSKSFMLPVSANNCLNYMLKKLWKYRMIKSSDLELIYRKYISTTRSLLIYDGEEMNLMECYCDRYGPIFVLRNDDNNIGVVAAICKFGAVFTSFDRSTTNSSSSNSSIGNAIKACRFLSCYAHLDLVEIA